LQSWVGNGHGPSQIGATVSSHGIGSHLHPSVPVVSGLQIVPGGQGPSQFGKGEVSQVMSKHSQRLVAVFSAQAVPGGHSPSQTGNGVCSHGTVGVHSQNCPPGSTLHVSPAGQAPSAHWSGGASLHEMPPQATPPPSSAKVVMKRIVRKMGRKRETVAA
jgi:hypothetical protein